MPPIRSQSSKKSIEQEGRILLAIQAIKKQEISSIHLRRAAPRPTTVQEIANLLLQQRRTTPVILTYNFIQRYPLLSSRFSRRYNYERAKCEDPKII
ncbi:uncharacterized protein N7500_006533 [Penicillium coprophilum]|uniref:uncharacterized protein n=1 Tax=Penicillium coprophilum TaxID=36646 RepID=UPI0023848DC3|nr:uncharacterized protein N7500_006533 [Penicillium coprophilum]KAJ5164703.1 hypothetical protein N7500_006533 [Penicillium coprophilum]